MKKKLTFITTAGLIAALYVALTYLCSALGLASGVIQVRFSEALAALCLFTPAAVPGLFIGCVISNLVTGCLPLDVVFGSLATLIGSFFAWYLRKHPIPALLMPVASNTLVVPFVLKLVYEVGDAWWFCFVTVFAGEVISCVILGYILYISLEKSGLGEKLRVMTVSKK